MRLLLIISLTFTILADAAEPTQWKLRLKLQSITTDEQMPMEMHTFLGLKDDMQVLELIPRGSGWYTKILGLVIEEKASCKCQSAPIPSPR